MITAENDTDTYYTICTERKKISKESLSCGTDRQESVRDVVRRCMVSWLSSSALVLIKVVTLRRARLILGWVTICG